uniref:Uncharacterized protein n=1 Tax=Rhizophagus irregularis (strain DAOM 181602 / DAOM 197198 / MUCL 43194) TaxID=747089 RepID=U9TK02_RHIID
MRFQFCTFPYNNLQKNLFVVNQELLQLQSQFQNFYFGLGELSLMLIKLILQALDSFKTDNAYIAYINHKVSNVCIPRKLSTMALMALLIINYSKYRKYDILKHYDTYLKKK